MAEGPGLGGRLSPRVSQFLPSQLLAHKLWSSMFLRNGCLTTPSKTATPHVLSLGEISLLFFQPGAW